jgi:hypothetical protein
VTFFLAWVISNASVLGPPNVMLKVGNYPRDQPSANADEESLWPFLHILVAPDDDDLDRWILHDFGTDGYLRPKGVVEVIL